MLIFTISTFEIFVSVYWQWNSTTRTSRVQFKAIFLSVLHIQHPSIFSTREKLHMNQNICEHISKHRNLKLRYLLLSRETNSMKFNGLAKCKQHSNEARFNFEHKFQFGHAYAESVHPWMQMIRITQLVFVSHPIIGVEHPPPSLYGVCICATHE